MRSGLVGAVAGAILVATIPWLSAAFGTRSNVGVAAVGPIGGNVWFVARLDTVAYTRVISQLADFHSGEFSDPLAILPSWSKVAIPTQFEEALIEDAAGWPLRSHWCRYRLLRATGSFTLVDQTVDGGYLLSYFTNFYDGRALPLRIWAGPLLVNWGVWSALSVAVCQLGGIRRVVRAVCGCCPNCGYAAGESERCSECGHSLPSVVAKP